MRHKVFDKKLKIPFLASFFALLVIATILNVVKFTTSTFAASLSDAQNVCSEVNGTFSDYTDSLSSIAGECRGDIKQSGAANLIQNACNNAEGIFTTQYGGSKFICTWTNFDDAAISPKASEVKALCESNEGVTFEDMTDYGYVSCHGLPETTCESKGGIYLSGICKWNNAVDDLSDAQDSEEQPTPAGEEATCSSQAGSLGWIICPTTESLAEGTDGIYGILAGFLDISPELFSADADKSPAFQMWNYFRTIANVILVIIFLVIIISQVTGVGIDNYGIKKTLPRIVVAVILINISYYLCQGAIDLSNIFGNGLSKALDAVAENTARAIGISTAEIFAAGFADILLAVVAIAAGAGTAMIGPISVLAGPAGFSASFWILMIPLIISILVALVSILIFFLMLGARQLIVMVCIAIAPLAIICYILPNTQKLFKRWLDILKALILIYPICSVLYGVSRLVRIMAFSADGTHIWMCMVAIMASFLPCLIAPSLIRKAFNGLGEIGARISGVGAAVRRGANGARRSVADAEMYKNANRQAQNYRTERTFRRLSGRYGSETAPTAPGPGASRRDLRHYRHAEQAYQNHQRRLAQAQIAQDKVEAERSAIAAAANPNFIQNQREAREDKDRLARENAIITQITRNGEYDGRNYGAGGKDLNALYNRFVELANTDESTITDPTRLQALRDERGAIYRKLASEKQGIGLLNEGIYHVGETGHLDATGLQAMNAHRIQNADVAAALAKKDVTGNMYLDDFAAGATTDFTHADGILNSNEISARYAARALSDNQRIADQSGAALSRHIRNVSPTQIANLVNDSNFRQIVTDAGNQQIVEDANYVNIQNAAGATRTLPGYSGSYYQAPVGWIQRAGSGTRAGHPIYDDPNDSNRHYDAQTNEFF